jgi:hypothetical protein
VGAMAAEGFPLQGITGSRKHTLLCGIVSVSTADSVVRYNDPFLPELATMCDMWAAYLTHPWVCHRPGRGGQRPPSDSIASAITACGER